MSSPLAGAYVRIAEPHEYSEAAWILTRGFAQDPCMNWFGSVKTMIPAYRDIPDYDAHPAAAKRALKNLHIFQTALTQATILSGGFITVAVIPNSNEDATQEAGTASGAAPGEIIAGATLWLRPGQPLDFPLSTIIRSGIWRVLRGWGLTGVKRVLLDFSPQVEKTLEKGFKARNLDRLDSWHLLEMSVDPQYQDKGLGSLMMKDGFERTSPKPVHLEATTAKSRDIYAHYGFEIDEEHSFGRSAVNEQGLAVDSKDAAMGYPEWIMTKWNYDSANQGTES
ncbi:hypothetical protein GALMADRAFT_238226 [Galerina marginata CBS 339.88]|uniref:Uncharacterized protein n=1 Tax=Galerina marginata (strain CBS 339.88) TaxID=685588 RepID=A0A067TUR3_GALM3|nr:hypothetical protein GALMADRAFT_238226 [Galerina marginata CBS 339.88]